MHAYIPHKTRIALLADDSNQRLPKNARQVVRDRLERFQHVRHSMEKADDLLVGKRAIHRRVRDCVAVRIDWRQGGPCFVNDLSCCDCSEIKKQAAPSKQRPDLLLPRQFQFRYVYNNNPIMIRTLLLFIGIGNGYSAASSKYPRLLWQFR